jgi:LAO/AO transport system kinase
MSIKMILGFRPHDEKSWLADVVKTVASEGKGIEEVAGQIRRHREYMQKNDVFVNRRSQQMKARIEEIIADTFTIQFWNTDRKQKLETELPAIIARSRSPYSVAEELLKK